MVTLVLGLQGCSSVPMPPADTTPSTSPGASPSPWQGPEVNGRLTHEHATDVTLYALSLVGTPYRYGGNTPDTGFDCSGLIGHVYQTRGGVVPPRTVAKLNFWGSPVTKQQLRSGDLVLFGPTGAPNHAGIYVGEGRFVHAPSAGGMVRLELVGSKHWASQRPIYRRP